MRRVFIFRSRTRISLTTSLYHRRTVKSHFRTSENTLQDDGLSEREDSQERDGGMGPGWSPGFHLTSPRQVRPEIAVFSHCI